MQSFISFEYQKNMILYKFTLVLKQERKHEDKIKISMYRMTIFHYLDIYKI